MKATKYIRNGKISLCLEVTKKDLETLKQQYGFISISDSDKQYIETIKDNEFVGLISGDIQYLLNDLDYKDVTDCWLVTNHTKHGYKQLDSKLDFGEAIKLLKNGYKAARTGWNGKGMFLFLVQGSTFKVNRPPLNTIYPEGTEVNYQPHVDMKTADDTIVPWLCSQSDMLAEDWVVVE